MNTFNGIESKFFIALHSIETYSSLSIIHHINQCSLYFVIIIIEATFCAKLYEINEYYLMRI